jgi:predicted nucleic acid-binding Zn ribbon protein
MKEKAVHNGYCLYCGKESNQPFCNRQCYLGHVRQNPRSLRDYEKQQRDDLTDRIVKRAIYIGSKGKIKFCQITFEMITKKRAEILAWRERKTKGRPVVPNPIKEKAYRICIVCGSTYEVKGKSLVCSVKCRNIDSMNKYRANRDVILSKLREEYEPKPKTERICAQCGNLFMGHDKDVYCSDTCRQRVKQGRKAKRRAEKLGVHYEPVSPLKVFKRDGWRCQLCGKKLNPKHRGTIRDDAPELDHIIPWAQGGEHSYRNTQCACRKCNQGKGARELGQLRLFG